MCIRDSFQAVRKTGTIGTAEIMVPLIDTHQELDLVRNSAPVSYTHLTLPTSDLV